MQMRKKPGAAVRAAALLLALLLIGAVIFAFVMGKAEERRLREDIRVFEPFDLTASYSYIEPILLSEGFAASFHEKVRYCFAMDRASRSYIVAVRAKDTGAYQALYDFTYGNSDTPPSGIILKGMPVKLSEEIVFYAMNAYGSIFGEQIADRDAFRTLFGTQYLDTTQKPAADQTPLLILGLLLILTGAAYAFLYARAGGYRTRRKAAKTQYSDQAAEISFRSRLPMGVLGAVLGAALGAVVWIVIGRIGFIAGLAGYPILLFAVAGYRLYGGVTDRKGQILSVVIALLMIPCANFTLYALEYESYHLTGNDRVGNLIRAFRELPGFLTYTDRWDAFIKDLLVGYALAVWSGLRIFLSGWKRKNSGGAFRKAAGRRSKGE